MFGRCGCHYEIQPVDQHGSKGRGKKVNEDGVLHMFLKLNESLSLHVVRWGSPLVCHRPLSYQQPPAHIGQHKPGGFVFASI
jgi:hypothetical protein